MKGISEFVLSLLLILILVSTITIVWLYYYGYLKFIESNSDTSQLGESLSSCMKIDSMSANKIYIKNCGNGVINNVSLAIYIDEQQFAYTMNPSPLAKGQIGTVQIDASSLSPGGHNITVTTISAQAVRYANVTLVAGNKTLNLIELA
jgi:hypothetical protein